MSFFLKDLLKQDMFILPSGQMLHKFDNETKQLSEKIFNDMRGCLCAVCKRTRVDSSGTILITVINKTGGGGQFTPAVICSACRSSHSDEQLMALAKAGELSNAITAVEDSLHTAAGKGPADLVKVLIEQGADIKAKDENGNTPLHMAAVGGQHAVAELLIAKGADVDALENQGDAPLHWAANRGHDNVARILICNKAKIDVKDNNGYTPLHMAGISGHHTTAELLLANGASVDAKDNKGLTPLHYAANRSHNVVVELLVIKGACVNATSLAGRSVLGVTSDLRITDFLKQHEAS